MFCSVASTSHENTDGSSYGNPGVGGAVCIFRDSNCNFLIAANEPLFFTTNYAAEATTLRLGLQIAIKMKYLDLIVEVDSKALALAIGSKELTPTNIYNDTIIKDIHQMLTQLQHYQIHWTFREGNAIADLFAKDATDKEGHTILASKQWLHDSNFLSSYGSIWITPPSFAWEQLEDDRNSKIYDTELSTENSANEPPSPDVVFDILDTLHHNQTFPIEEKILAMNKLILGMSAIMPEGRLAYEDACLFDRIAQSSANFVEFLKMKNFPELQSASAWVLASVAAVNAEIVIEHGVVPIFVELIFSTHEQVCEHALWALGNLAPECCDLALGDLIQFVCSLSGKENCRILRNAAWALTNFCGETPNLDVLPALKHLIHSSDEHVLADVCWTLSRMSDITDYVTLSDILHILVKLLDHSSLFVINSALHTVGNIVARSQAHTQIIIDLGALSSMRNLLKGNYSHSIKKAACWTLSNIIVENKDNLQAVLDADIIRWLAFILIGTSPIRVEIPPNSEVQQEAAWAISNAGFVASSDQIHQLTLEHCVKALSWLLVCSHPCIEVICLEGLHNMMKHDSQDWVIRNLESHDGFFNILSLRETHEDPHIRLKAKMFMDLYWKDRLEDYDYVDDDETSSPPTWRVRGEKRIYPSPSPFPIVPKEQFHLGVGVIIVSKGGRVLNAYFDETRPNKRFPKWEETSSIKKVKVRYYHATFEHEGDLGMITGVVKDLFETEKGKVIQIDFNKAKSDIEDCFSELGIGVVGDVVMKLRKLFDLFKNPNRLACLDIYDFEFIHVQRTCSRGKEISSLLESLYEEIFSEY